MRFLSILRYIALAPIRPLHYKLAREIDKERVIKLGTICRKFWILFPPIILYQYIRQNEDDIIHHFLLSEAKDPGTLKRTSGRVTDKEMLTTEKFYKMSSSVDHRAFYDPKRPRDHRNWKTQNDLLLLSLAANKNSSK